MKTTALFIFVLFVLSQRIPEQECYICKEQYRRSKFFVFNGQHSSEGIDLIPKQDFLFSIFSTAMVFAIEFLFFYRHQPDHEVHLLGMEEFSGAASDS